LDAAPAEKVDNRADAGDAGAAKDAHAPDAQAPDAGERPLDPARVRALVDDAEASDSDGLVIVKDGELVGQWLFGKPNGPIETMSITKSVIGLAVGTLVDAGKLQVDETVSSIYPEWRSDDRKQITILELLTHSSGLEEGDSTAPIYRSHDWVRFTLKSKLIHPPGTHFEYSNRAANLLSGIVEKVSGMPTDEYVKKALFAPLGIRDFSWTHDKAGHAGGMAGLHLRPRDLAKLGELVESDGKHDGRQLVSADWVRSSTRELAPVQPANKRLGRLWWLMPEWSTRVIDDGVIAAWRAAGVSETFIEKVSPLEDRSFSSTPALLAALGGIFGDDLSEWNETTWKRDLPDVHFDFGPLVGVYAAGTLGQYLVVLPRDRLVVARMRRAPKVWKDRDNPKKTMPDFVERVLGLLASS
jgi:CubicO group peptidase (beta-lactamase class C family)